MNLKNLGEKVLLLVIAGLLSYFTSPPAGQFYDSIFPGAGSWIDFTALIGLPIAFIFFLTFLFSAFGGNGKYWWIGVLLILPTIFVYHFDIEHVYFYVADALAGFLLGQGVRFLLVRAKVVR